MQALDDESLAGTTGQDGITVTISTKNDKIGRIGFDRISIQDGDGFGSTNVNPASIGYFAATSDAGGVGFYSGVTGTTAIATPVTIRMDADSNAGNPVLNTSVSFDSNLTRINLPAFAIALTADTADHAANPSDHSIIANSRRDLIKVGGAGIDIKFKTGSTLGVNVQLGNEPQGHMIMFTGGQITQINNDPSSPIEVVSYAGNTPSSSLKFNFDLKANAASTNGIRLKDMYIDIGNNGMTFGKAGNTDKFDVAITDVIAGCSTGCANATTFDGLKNASMGSFGVIGASVNNLKVNVKGM